VRKQRVIVTGAAGFIGSALANFLTSNYEVIGIDNLAAGDWTRCNPEVKVVQGDVSELSEAALDELFDKVTFLFHLAAVKLHNQLNDSGTISKTNIEGTRRIFEAASKAGVRKVIFTSSLYAYGSLGPSKMIERDPLIPFNFYGLSKSYGESLLEMFARESKLDYAIARLFFIYGPWQYAEGGYKSVIMKNIDNAINGLPLEVNGDGNQALDYVYIDDCVEILWDLAKSDFNGVINVSSGVSTSINRIVETIGTLSGVLERKFNPRDWTHGSSRAGDIRLREAILGPRQLTGIELGLEKTWNWARAKKPS
jgi:UDP-glucose 4-epimerase